MSQDAVSLTQGHESLASGGVSPADPSLHRSRYPILFSQYRGPHIYNMAETPEEKAAREAKEAADKEKQTNFDKVRIAREKAEARVAELEAEKLAREKADKAAADKKLAEDGNLQALADAKTKEAEAKTAEAAAEKTRADAAEAKLKKIEDQQEAELVELLKQIPTEKQPPLDAADPVDKRLGQVKYALTLLGKEPKPAVGAGVKKEKTAAADRLVELRKKGINNLTPDENLELMELTTEDEE